MDELKKLTNKIISCGGRVIKREDYSEHEANVWFEYQGKTIVWAGDTIMIGPRGFNWIWSPIYPTMYSHLGIDLIGYEKLRITNDDVTTNDDVIDEIIDAGGTLVSDDNEEITLQYHKHTIRLTSEGIISIYENSAINMLLDAFNINEYYWPERLNLAMSL